MLNWHHVARNLQEGIGKTVTARSASERIDFLISHYASEDRVNLRKSGTENEYNEHEHLLQEVLHLAREFAFKVRACKKAPLGERAARRLANETRGAAAAKYEGTSHTTGHGAIAESPLALFSEMTDDTVDDEASSRTVTNEDLRPASVEPTSSIASMASTDEIAPCHNATTRSEPVRGR
ncbi:hypothetical protein MTO96_041746 [Rhipicephalus appendiculatus]